MGGEESGMGVIPRAVETIFNEIGCVKTHVRVPRERMSTRWWQGGRGQSPRDKLMGNDVSAVRFARRREL
jgi:hypothetical protein